MKNAVDRRGRNAEAKEAGRKGKGVIQGDEQIDVLTSTLVVVGHIFLPQATELSLPNREPTGQTQAELQRGG